MLAVTYIGAICSQLPSTPGGFMFFHVTELICTVAYFIID